MEKIDNEQKGDSIINRYVLVSMGTGLIPIPIFDLVALTGIQVKMVHSLAEIYNVEFSDHVGKSIIGSLIGGILPVSFSPFVGSLIKAIPIIGQTTSVITMPVVGGAATYAAGKVFQRHFASGGTMSDFDPKESKDFLQEKYEEGKTIAANHLKKDKSKEAEEKKEEPKAKKEEPKGKKEEPKAKKEEPKVKKQEIKEGIATKKDISEASSDKSK